jgi:hypothetical protein
MGNRNKNAVKGCRIKDARIQSMIPMKNKKALCNLRAFLFYNFYYFTIDLLNK